MYDIIQFVVSGRRRIHVSALMMKSRGLWAHTVGCVHLLSARGGRGGVPLIFKNTKITTSTFTSL